MMACSTSDLSQSLSCKVCSNPFSDPRLLFCLHVFCKSCLDPLYSYNEQGTLTCPVCYQINTCPPPAQLSRHIRMERQATLSKLRQSEVQVTTCQNCDDNKKAATVYCKDCACPICFDCQNTHQLLKVTKNHSIIEINHSQLQSLDANASSSKHISNDQQHIPCIDHPDKFVEYFCCECDCFVCSKCLYSHKSHDWYCLDNAELFEKKKNEIKSVLPALEEATAPLAKTSNKLDAITEDLYATKEETIRKINFACDQIIEAVEKRRAELIEEAKKSALAKLTRLQMQQEELDQIMGKLKLVLETGTTVANEYSNVEFLSLQNSIAQASDRVQKDVSSFDYHPACNSSLNLAICTSEVIDSISSLGSIVQCYSPHCVLANVNPERPIGMACNCQCTLTLQTKNENNIDLCVGGALVVAKVVSDSNVMNSITSSPPPECIVKDLKNGKYEVTINHPTEGHFQLQIDVDCVPICNGTPYKLNVRDYSSINCWPLKSSPVLPSKPNLIDIGPDGLLYVTTEIHICVFNDKLEIIRKILRSTVGEYDDVFKGIALSRNGTMFVACKNRNVVIKATLDGKPIARTTAHHFAADDDEDCFSFNQSVSSRLNSPFGVCLAKNGDFLMIGDSNNKCIRVLKSSDLSYVRSIPCYSLVRGVSIDSNGNIHAAVGNRVEVFTVDGEKITEYGQDVLTSAGDIAFLQGSTNPYSFVTDCSSSQYSRSAVHVFDWANNILVNSAGDKKCHYGVTISQEGTIIMCAYSNKKLVCL